MAFADEGIPLLGQVRFCTALVFLECWCPSDIELQMFILLYLWILPVFGDAFLIFPRPTYTTLGFGPPCQII